MQGEIVADFGERRDATDGRAKARNKRFSAMQFLVARSRWRSLPTKRYATVCSLCIQNPAESGSSPAAGAAWRTNRGPAAPFVYFAARDKYAWVGSRFRVLGPPASTWRTNATRPTWRSGLRGRL